MTENRSADDEIIECEKSPGQIDNPELSKKLKDSAQEKAEVAAEHVSIANRLSRRSKVETIKIPFVDDLGEFFVEVRLPTTAEMEKLMSFEKFTTDPTAGKKDLELANDGLCTLLSELAVDPSLDFNFFRNGDFLASDLSQIVKEIFLEEERRIRVMASFRQKPKRA